MKRIEVLVLPDGQTRLEVSGFAGAACREASRPLIEALGLATTDRPTAEAYAPAPVQAPAPAPVQAPLRQQQSPEP